MITFPTLFHYSKKCELFSFHSFKVNWKCLQIILCYIQKNDNKWNQRAKIVLSDSPGLVDFDIGLVINSVFNLPNGQVIFFCWGIRITEELWNQFC